jgi:hypothetical protein
MPFPPQKPQPFDRACVEAVRSGMVGCYGLFQKDRWVYIGKGDIRQRLLGHLDDDGPWALAHRPTHWVAVETADYDAVERELVLACDPVYTAPTNGAGAQRVQAVGRRGSGR